MLSPAANKSTVPSLPPLYGCVLEDAEAFEDAKALWFAASDELSSVISSESVFGGPELFEPLLTDAAEEASSTELHPENNLKNKTDASRRAGNLYRKGRIIIIAFKRKLPF